MDPGVVIPPFLPHQNPLLLLIRQQNRPQWLIYPHNLTQPISFSQSLLSTENPTPPAPANHRVTCTKHPLFPKFLCVATRHSNPEHVDHSHNFTHNFSLPAPYSHAATFSITYYFNLSNVWCSSNFPSTSCSSAAQRYLSLRVYLRL